MQIWEEKKLILLQRETKDINKVKREDKDKKKKGFVRRKKDSLINESFEAEILSESINRFDAFNIIDFVKLCSFECVFLFFNWDSSLFLSYSVNTQLRSHYSKTVLAT